LGRRQFCGIRTVGPAAAGFTETLQPLHFDVISPEDHSTAETGQLATVDPAQIVPVSETAPRHVEFVSQIREPPFMLGECNRLGTLATVSVSVAASNGHNSLAESRGSTL
jgi:hypothetical protein